MINPPHSGGPREASPRDYMRPLLVAALSGRAFANVTYRHIGHASTRPMTRIMGLAFGDTSVGGRSTQRTRSGRASGGEVLDGKCGGPSQLANALLEFINISTNRPPLTR